MVGIPTRLDRDLLLAEEAEPFLPFEDHGQQPSTMEFIEHDPVRTIFKVYFVLRIIRICLAFDFHMALNGYGACFE